MDKERCNASKAELCTEVSLEQLTSIFSFVVCSLLLKAKSSSNNPCQLLRWLHGNTNFDCVQGAAEALDPEGLAAGRCRGASGQALLRRQQAFRGDIYIF